jgi:dipeptidyl aminopeptidase/acylaminoacyl peptidase
MPFEQSNEKWNQSASNKTGSSVAALAAAMLFTRRQHRFHRSACRGGARRRGRPSGRNCGIRAARAVSTSDSRIIPRDILFGNPEYASPSLSPDARFLAYLKPSDEGVLNVWVRTVGAADDHQVTTDTYRGIRFFTWAEDSQTLLYLQDSGGDENFHVWGINAMIAGSVAKDLTPYDGVKAQNLSTNKRFPNTILVGMNKRNPQLFDMYRVDLQTAEACLDTENPGDVMAWHIEDEAFTVRAASASNPDDSSTIVRVRDSPDDEWRELVTFPYGEEGEFVSFSKDGKTCLMQTTIGSDTKELVRMDLATCAKLETIAADPRCDVGAVMQDRDTKELLAVAFNYARLERRYFNEAVESDFAFLGEQGPEGAEPLVVSRDREDQSWVVAFRRDDGPMEYAIYSRVAKTVTPLFVSQPALKEYKLAPMECVNIEARDGLKMVGYLTRSRADVATPMVLLVHGGPWARDSWGFNPSAQWLANRGYAVLQVNYRASTGFGKSFLHAGDRQWGAKMQDDLTDSVRWAVSQGIALEDKICIYGGSYGGYACLAGLTFTPDVYACGVDIVGPSNAKTLLDSIPAYWKPIRNDLLLKIGNIDEDEEFNRAISPLFHAEKITVPLLIGQGANDPRVKQAEADQIVQAMIDKSIPVDYILYPDEGHGFARPQNRIDFQGRTELFLEKHLGGRSESFTPPEGNTALLPILDGSLGKPVASAAAA